MKGKIKTSKNSKKLSSFINYCLANPDLRFWQALRNWDDSAFIFRQREHQEGMTQQLEDTFYE